MCLGKLPAILVFAAWVVGDGGRDKSIKRRLIFPFGWILRTLTNIEAT